MSQSRAVVIKKATTTPKKEEIRAFKTAKAWEAFLARPRALKAGLWLRIYKKDSGVATITYAQALDGALCYGWIDSQKSSLDEQSWLQRFSPRRPKGLWSKVNIGHVERLSAAGRMKPAGLKAVEAAKADGRWGRAYDGSRSMVVPKDFLAAVAKHKGARAFYTTLSRANTFAIAFRLQTAKKPGTRQARFDKLLAMLKQGVAIHS